MALESGMVHLGHLRMVGEEIDHLQGILHMTLHTQTQCLDTLQQDKCIKWRNSSSCIAQDDGTDAGDVSSGTYCISEDDAMVRRIGLRQRGEFVVLLPVELTTIDDDTTE